MDFAKISNYLLKFKKLQAPEKAIRIEIVKNIHLITGIVLEEKTVKINNSAVFLEVNPLIKNEIFYKKREIVDSCKKRAGIIITALR